jgi:hypothetical protein
VRQADRQIFSAGQKEIRRNVKTGRQRDKKFKTEKQTAYIQRKRPHKQRERERERDISPKVEMKTVLISIFKDLFFSNCSVKCQGIICPFSQTKREKRA